jgi:ATP-dependent DNA helicase PIF1
MHLSSSSSSNTAQPDGEAMNESSTTITIEESMLNPEQSAAAARATRGESIFLTGAAGVGKSFVLRFIIQRLKEKLPSEDLVAITAPTGIAASHIGGQTIHSFGGIGLGKGSISDLIKKVQKNSGAVARWRKIKVLILDEVSMLDSKLLEKLDAIAKDLRRSSASFGGIQLIFCGDFFQLAPVSLGWDNAGYAFESAVWRESRIATCQLQTIVRQQGEN